MDLEPVILCHVRVYRQERVPENGTMDGEGDESYGKREGKEREVSVRINGKSRLKFTL